MSFDYPKGRIGMKARAVAEHWGCSTPAADSGYWSDAMDGEGRVVVVSNRAPSIFPRPSAEERRTLPVGGLVSSLRPFLEASGGIWMGWDGNPDDQDGAAPAKITRVENIRLASVSLSADEVEGFY